MKWTGLIFFGTILIITAIFRICMGISFDMKCTQYLKRTADANTVELAKQNIDIAIKYIEANNLTNGIVSIILKQPENDIGFWYSNLIASRDELSKVTNETTQLEKSNILMKLRETLTDVKGGQYGGGTVITRPDEISIYPFNVLFFILFLVSGLGTVYFLCWVYFSEAC